AVGVRGRLAVNLESANVAPRFRPIDLDRLDARIRLRLPVPIDARFDERLVSLEHRLDTAVQHVANIAVEPEFFRFVRAVRAEVDALDAPPEDDDRADPHLDAKSMSPERTLLYARPLSLPP